MQERGKGLRRRLRELTDRSLALGAVHGRFAPADRAAPTESPIAPPIETEKPIVSPVPGENQETPQSPPITPAIFAMRAPEESHEKLLAALVERHPDGFTVSQMKDVLEAVDGRTRSYDAAWTLANTLLRNRALEIAGSRPGPTGPIRVLRVNKPLPTPAEAR